MWKIIKNNNVYVRDMFFLFFRLFFRLWLYFITIIFVIWFFKYWFEDYIENKTNSYQNLWNIKEVLFDKWFYTGEFRENIKRDVITIALKENMKDELIDNFDNIFINYQYLNFNKKFSNSQNQSIEWNYKNWEYVKTYKTLSIFNIQKEWRNYIYNPMNLEYWSVILHESIHLILNNNPELKLSAKNLMIQVIQNNTYIKWCIYDKNCNNINTKTDQEKNDYIIYNYYNNILNTYSWNQSWNFYRKVFNNSLIETDDTLIEELIAFSLQNKENRENLIKTEYGETLVNLFFN